MVASIYWNTEGVQGETMTIDERMFDQFDSQFEIFRSMGDQRRKQDSTLGATMWDFLLRVDLELKELIQSLMSTDGHSHFSLYARRHKEIVSYLTRLGKSRVIDARGLNIRDIQKYEDLHQRYEHAKPLVQRIEEETRRLRLLEEKKRSLVSFLADYKAGLLNDPDLRPDNVRNALESDSLKAEAHSEFIREYGGSQGVERTSLGQVKALLPANPDRISGVEIMVKKYHVGIVFLGYVNRIITETSTKLPQLQSQLSSFRLTPEQIADLDRFKEGKHPTYNAGTYFHGYSRTLMGNAKELIGYIKGL